MARGPLVTHQQFLRRFWAHWINLGLNAQRPLCVGHAALFWRRTDLRHVPAVLWRQRVPVPAALPVRGAGSGGSRGAKRPRCSSCLPCCADCSRWTKGEGLLMPSLSMLLSSGSPLHADGAARDPRDDHAPLLRDVRDDGRWRRFAAHAGGPGAAWRFRGPAMFAVEVQIVDEHHHEWRPGETGACATVGPAAPPSSSATPQRRPRCSATAGSIPVTSGPSTRTATCS